MEVIARHGVRSAAEVMSFDVRWSSELIAAFPSHEMVAVATSPGTPAG
jgi:hypothetical protein